MRWLWLCVLVACDNDAVAPGEGPTPETTVAPCVELCVDSGFSNGDEAEYAGGLFECQCTGGGGQLQLGDCVDYCAGHDVDEFYSYLSTSLNANDKCVCDGTQG